jgi:hypothetical protein
MTATDELIANNDAYAASFDKGELPLPPAKKVAVLACMDARLNVYCALGLTEGDAHVIRNAGGAVTDDGIRSLAISQRLLGNRGDHPDPSHRLRHAHLHRRRVQELDPAGNRDQAGVGGGVVLRSRHRRSPVDRADQGVTIHPSQGLHSRLRLRGRDRTPARGQLSRHRRCEPSD